jgi:predicted outer membrane repeat protein
LTGSFFPLDSDGELWSSEESITFYPFHIFSGEPLMIATIRRWFDRSVTTGKARQRYVPRIECLENRLTPANWTVSSAADAGADTLRAVLTNIEGHEDVTHTVSFSVSSITVSTALPPVGKDVTFNGGSGVHIYRGSGGGVPQFRVLTINGGTVQINNMEFSNGHTTSGGGIFITGGATVTLYQCAITGNTASGNGGGIYNEGTLTVTSTNVEYNEASGSGGGIFTTGDLTVNSASDVSNNGAGSSGGGICINDDDAEVAIDYSDVTWNAATEGAGIYNCGSLSIDFSDITNNFNAAYGGGVYCVAGSTTVLDCAQITNNTANTAAPLGGGGFYVEQSASVTLTHCTVSGNTGGVAGGSAGALVEAGGTFSADGTNTITDAIKYL